MQESCKSQSLRVTKEELAKLLDAMSAFIKHENLEEMANMLCKYCSVQGQIHRYGQIHGHRQIHRCFHWLLGSLSAKVV